MITTKQEGIWLGPAGIDELILGIFSRFGNGEIEIAGNGNAVFFRVSAIFRCRGSRGCAFVPFRRLAGRILCGEGWENEEEDEKEGNRKYDRIAAHGAPPMVSRLSSP